MPRKREIPLIDMGLGYRILNQDQDLTTQRKAGCPVNECLLRRYPVHYI